jgi:uncharacterized membrane protein HdeD (DUF308 family)
MRLVIANNWWSLVIRGIVAIIVGLISLLWPGITLSALVILFGAYALLDGIFSFVGAWRASQAHERWGSLLLEGVVGIAAAVVTLLWPAITLFTLIYIVAAWAIFTGALELTAAIKLRKHIAGEWLLALLGIASLVFGILVLLAPMTGGLVIAIWIGTYALIFGVMLVALGFRLRAWSRSLESGSNVPIHV